MLSLTDPIWRELESTYGRRDRVAALISLAASSAPIDRWYDDLFQELCHQYTLSESAYAAVPHLVALAAEKAELRENLLLLVGWCYACAQLPDTPPVPAEMEPEWRSASSNALPLVGEILGQKHPSDEKFRHLLSALAAINGHYPLASILEGLDGEFECPNCGTFIDAKTSNLNMLR